MRSWISMSFKSFSLLLTCCYWVSVDPVPFNSAGVLGFWRGPCHKAANCRCCWKVLSVQVILKLHLCYRQRKFAVVTKYSTISFFTSDLKLSFSFWIHRNIRAKFATKSSLTEFAKVSRNSLHLSNLWRNSTRRWYTYCHCFLSLFIQSNMDRISNYSVTNPGCLPRIPGPDFFSHPRSRI